MRLSGGGRVKEVNIHYIGGRCSGGGRRGRGASVNYLFGGDREDTDNIETKAATVAAGILFDLRLSHDE